jgi:hypothetical protein
MEGSAFPVSTEQDDDQVTTALDTASALWSRGDAREALRWLRRAAEMAGEAGDDFRAVQLARAAADLSSELQIPPTLVPATSGPLAPRSYPSHAPPVAVPTQPNHARPPGPPAPAFSSSPISARGRPLPPRRGVEPYEVVTSAPPLAPEPLSRSIASATSPRPRQALHVAVIPADDDRNLLYVRILADGEAPPTGSHEALLVALEPQTNLLVRRR